MIIAANKSGQMCNQVIEFMHLYSMALEHNNILFQLYSSDYESVFKCEVDASCDYIRLRLRFASKIMAIMRAVKVMITHKPIPMKRQDHDGLKCAIRDNKFVCVKDSFLRDFVSLEKQKKKVYSYFDFKEWLNTQLIINVPKIK